MNARSTLHLQRAVSVIIHGDDITDTEVARQIIEDVFCKRKNTSGKLWDTANSNRCKFTRLAYGTQEQMEALIQDTKVWINKHYPECKLRFSITD